jgi:NAD(P) transhydrogenase subunit alpha
MIAAAPRETYPGEARVSVTPASVSTLTARGWEVRVEVGAGSAAGFDDEAYESKGATLVSDRAALLREADVVLQVRTFGANPEVGRGDLDLLRPGQVVIGFADPLGSPEAIRELAQRGVTLLALELLPRISRAQSMDALSAMATVSGYKAVLLAAVRLPRLFPLLMTAAGTLPPAKVLVLGAGVAGLQAISTARRLGAVVRAYDVRPVARAEGESVGATFLELPLDTAGAEAGGGYARAMDESFYDRQRQLLTEALIDTDVVVATAAIPGARAPLLVTAEMVRRMRPGSVIVDLAAATGGNCEATRPDQVIDVEGVAILGPTNLPATVPHDASLMYARNIAALLTHLTDKEGRLKLDLSDEITRGTLVVHQGEVVSERVRSLLGLSAGGGA